MSNLNKSLNPLGRIALHDEKSRVFAHRVLPAVGVSVTHRMNSDHLDQFYLGACVGFFGAQFLNTRMAQHSRAKYNVAIKAERNKYIRYLNNNDGIENYHESTIYDPFEWTYPPNDEGSSALGLMKWWKSIGVIQRYEWAFNFDQFLAALQVQPVGVGSDWYEMMTNPDEKGIAHPLGSFQGGHQYLANKLLWGSRFSLPSKRKIGFEQSWGEDIEFPSFYMLWEEFEDTVFNYGGDVVIPIVL